MNKHVVEYSDSSIVYKKIMNKVLPYTIYNNMGESHKRRPKIYIMYNSMPIIC